MLHPMHVVCASYNMHMAHAMALSQVMPDAGHAVECATMH
jgi:hypothetical protein